MSHGRRGACWQDLRTKVARALLLHRDVPGRSEDTAKSISVPVNQTRNCSQCQVQSARDVPELRMQVFVFSTGCPGTEEASVGTISTGCPGTDASERGAGRRVMQHVTQYCCKAPTLHSQATDAEWSNVTGAACRCATHCWLASYLHEQTLMCASRKDHRSIGHGKRVAVLPDVG